MQRHGFKSSAFAELGIQSAFLKALDEMEFVEPTEIQRDLIPRILEGHDVFGQARTGTGKTAGFGLPILQQIDPAGRLQALVLAPTRELAVQVAGELKRLARHAQIHCVPVYGGQKIKHQLHLLGRRPHVVIGTPGRLLDLLGRRALRFDSIRFAVLDEVDRMLDIGFRDDIRDILGRIKTEHQTTFVSATISDEIKRLGRQFMRDPVEVDVSRDQITVSEVAQAYFSVDPWDKFRLLFMLLKREKPQLAIVFTNTKHAARKLAGRLHRAGIDAKEIHGDLVQQRRERIMEQFRKHRLHVLVATDLASRGIDVHAISHIINYDVPNDPEVYVHRVGRTARMGAFGQAFTLVTRDQGKQLTEIEKVINQQVEQAHMEGFKPSPPPDDVAPVEKPPVPTVSRFESAVFGDRVSPSTATVTRRKTLGGKFRPARSRRRR